MDLNFLNSVLIPVIDKVLRLRKAIPYNRSLIGLIPNKFLLKLASNICNNMINKSKIVHIETTTYCNAKCVMCPHNIMPRRNHFMDDKSFYNIVNQLGDFLVKRVNLSIIGEPLLDHNIFERINYISSLKFRTRIFTNASLLSQKNAKLLLKSGLNELFVSLNGYDAESHQKMMRFNRNMFKQCVNNLIYFAALNSKYDSIVDMHLGCLLEWEPDQCTVDIFNNTWSKIGFSSHIGKPVGWHRNIHHKFSETYYPCPYIFSEIVIDVNSNVIACCRDYQSSIIFGNLKEASLYSIINGNKLKLFHNIHLSGRAAEIPLCKKCEVPNKFDFWNFLRY